MTPRLLIVEDNPEIASALLRGLALNGYEAETEARADRALDRILSERFTGAIVDVMLGSASGIDLVREARALGATLPVLMLSALSDVDHRAAGLEAGADDYVVKPFDFDELIARLRVQEQRAATRSPARLDAATRTLQGAAGTVTLTEREFDLLAYLVRTGPDPQPRGAIFDALWAGEGRGHENVVDVYIGYLRRKLEGAEFGFEIKTIRNRGFCLSGTPPRGDTP